MIYDSISDCIGNTPLVRLKRLFPHEGLDVLAKTEFLNPFGSVKDRVAKFIIHSGLEEKSILPETHLIESSSGNLGIAMAVLAQLYALPFTCVVDPNIAPANLKILRAAGAYIDMVHEVDDQGSYLKTRLRRVQELLQTIPNSLWINQYANQRNWLAHYNLTGNEILMDLDQPLDCLVVAVSTTGTIMGVARRLRESFPHLRVIAVDAVGSVIFGASAGPRYIPGIGSSRTPELLCREEIDEVVYVSDAEAVQGCMDLISHEGILAGGSSGAVISAIKKLLPIFPHPYRVLTLLPDRGERYLDTVFDDGWLHRKQAEESSKFSYSLLG